MYGSGVGRASACVEYVARRGAPGAAGRGGRSIRPRSYAAAARIPRRARIPRVPCVTALFRGRGAHVFNGTSQHIAHYDRPTAR